MNWHQKHWCYSCLSTCWAALGGCSWDGMGFDYWEEKQVEEEKDFVEVAARCLGEERER